MVKVQRPLKPVVATDLACIAGFLDEYPLDLSPSAGNGF
jgi:hypothetical protein